VSDSGSESQILDLSNRFYTLIPHDFGMKKPPLLNNLEYIQVLTGNRVLFAGNTSGMRHLTLNL